MAKDKHHIGTFNESAGGLKNKKIYYHPQQGIIIQDIPKSLTLTELLQLDGKGVLVWQNPQYKALFVQKQAQEYQNSQSMLKEHPVRRYELLGNTSDEIKLNEELKFLHNDNPKREAKTITINPAVNQRPKYSKEEYFLYLAGFGILVFGSISLISTLAIIIFS